ncbi:hypothetical protein JX265_005821 [Neoarthrinium moseri]|uniref:Nitroreductase domain-containing protein n=2 Tax=Neoarthrinium moseri TaxID=1658444 RepID=A0A9P9WNB8_9PEZI|nr:hypothetical protein JX265_005821 [Neoarthrinium moseri]
MFPSLAGIPSHDNSNVDVSPKLFESLSGAILAPLGLSASRGAPTTASFLESITARRTWYALDKTLPTTQERITGIVQDAMQSVPSSFNAQSNRAVVLFGAEHEKLWDIVTGVLKTRVSEDQWISTSAKTAGFRAAAGTVLFFVDTEVVQNFVENIPSYADQFPIWATQSDAMLQHTVWVALATEGLGGNLQHYNPLIDTKVAEAWDLPTNWRLTSQLVFGGRIGPTPEPKEKKSVQEKVRVVGMAGGA